MYHKPTFVLRFGKSATCGMSFMSIVIGHVLLVSLMASRSAVIAIILQVYFISGYFMLYTLWRVSTLSQEQTAIGIGAKMGNGLLTNLLAVFILFESGAPLSITALFSGILASIHFVNYISLVSRPHAAIIGYKG